MQCTASKVCTPGICISVVHPELLKTKSLQDTVVLAGCYFLVEEMLMYKHRMQLSLIWLLGKQDYATI